MIFAIATTTLNKEVKRKLKTGQYSREEATFIYSRNCSICLLSYVWYF